MLILHIVFWFAAFCMFHSYVLYPFLLWILSRGQTHRICDEDTELPMVYIVMSVFNEIEVIDEKMQSLMGLTYPLDRLQIHIGSDHSNDGTNAVLQQYAEKYAHVHAHVYKNRRGKPSVINNLVAHINADCQDQEAILIISDASVMLGPHTLQKMMRHYVDPKIGMVDSNIQPASKSTKGISKSEGVYISREVMMKYQEGLIWGKTMGPLGGCYSIRLSLYEPIPQNYLVDDFYIAMHIFRKKYKAISDIDAICYESFPSSIKEEFRRKTRISAGNFTNLMTFYDLLWPPWSALSFVFLSHKVLRWLGPFFILIMFFSSLALSLLTQDPLYMILCCGMGFSMIIVPLLDRILSMLQFNFLLLRSITYFYAMNFALLKGFYKYLKGIQHGIWEPTKRNE